MKKHLPWYGWLAIIFIAVFGAGMLSLFGWQTWEFVNFLLPKENLLMQILAVINFDGMALVWLMLRLFVPLEDGSKTTAIICGGLDFLLSLVCSVIQMTIADAERFFTSIDHNLIYFADGVVLLALVANIVGLLIVFEVEWPYISGQKAKKVKDVPPSEPMPQTPQPVYNPQPVSVSAASQTNVRSSAAPHTLAPFPSAPTGPSQQSQNGNGAKS